MYCLLIFVLYICIGFKTNKMKNTKAGKPPRYKKGTKVKHYHRTIPEDKFIELSQEMDKRLEEITKKYLLKQ